MNEDCSGIEPTLAMDDDLVSDAVKIAVVGFGPKGFYGLERLLANLKSQDAEGGDYRRVEVHAFHRSFYPVCGEVYRPDQPRWLLMNFSNGHIDAWSRTAGEPVAVVNLAHNFVEWLAIHPEHGVAADPHGYAPRAVVGLYLLDAWAQLLGACPPHVSITVHRADVRELTTDSGDGMRLRCRARSSAPLPESTESEADHVLLTTGHQQVKSIDDSPRHVNFIYPTERLGADQIAADSTVAVRGMGLTFVDAVLALTEGRGGVFESGKSEEFCYQASGSEPRKIFPFSRSGLPMIPRGKTYGVKRSSPNFLLPVKKKLQDFDQALWPAICAEMSLAYYRVAAESKGESFPSCFVDERELLCQIDEFHHRHADVKPFHPADFFKTLPDSGDRHASVVDYLAMLIDEAEKGEGASPMYAAAMTWRHLTEIFAKCYRFGGLTGPSQQIFLERYANHLNRISFGPPLVNSRKVLALCRSGILDFSFAKNPEVRFADQAAKDEPVVTLVDGDREIRCDAFIDARIPKINVEDDPSPLFRGLIQSGLARHYVNRVGCASGDGFAPGCIEISTAGHPIDAQGNEQSRITLYGTPTEGLTWDNDTLSRSHNDFASGWGKQVARVIRAGKTHVSNVSS